MKKIFKNTFCFLLSILLIMCLCFTVLIFNFKKVVNKENVKNIASTINIMKIPIDEDLTIEKYISNYTNNNDLPKRYIDTILESPKVNEVINESIGKLVDYAIYGKEIPYITSEEVENAIDYDEIEKKLNIKLTDADKNKISTYSKDVSSNINNAIEKYIVNLEDKKTNDNIKLIRFLFSSEIKLYLVILIFILIFLIIMIQKWNIIKSFLPLGVSFIISGIIILLGSIFINYIFNVIKMVNNKDIIQTILNVFNKVKINFIYSSLIILIIGLVFLILYSIFKKRLHREVK